MRTRISFTPTGSIWLAACCLWLLASAIPTAAAAQANQPDDVVVTLDGNPLEESEVYEIEKDNTFQLIVKGLKPNSEVFVKVKFAGPLGVKKETRTIDDSGTFRWLFDTPNRNVSANCEVTYQSASGRQHTRTFKLKVR